MNNNLLAQIFYRITRGKNKNIIWVCDSIRDIGFNFNEIKLLGINCEFDMANHMIRMPNGLRITFITNNIRVDKLAGLNVDEVIIDESGD